MDLLKTTTVGKTVAALKKAADAKLVMAAKGLERERERCARGGRRSDVVVVSLGHSAREIGFSPSTSTLFCGSRCPPS